MSVIKEMEKTKYWWKYHSEQRQEQTPPHIWNRLNNSKKGGVKSSVKKIYIFLLQRHRRQDYYERKRSHKSTPIRSILQKKVQTIPHTPVNNAANLRAFCFSVLVF